MNQDHIRKALKTGSYWLTITKGLIQQPVLFINLPLIIWLPQGVRDLQDHCMTVQYILIHTAYLQSTMLLFISGQRTGAGLLQNGRMRPYLLLLKTPANTAYNISIMRKC